MEWLYIVSILINFNTIFLRIDLVFMILFDDCNEPDKCGREILLGVLIELIRSNSDRAIVEEQCLWGEEICDYYLRVNREVFMGLEKPYDRIDWNALWQVLRIYGVGRNLL